MQTSSQLRAISRPRRIGRAKIAATPREGSTKSSYEGGPRCIDHCRCLITHQTVFPITLAQRIATNDPRPSLQERYGTTTNYVAKVQAAAQALVARRFLLEQDIATYTGPAASVTIPAGP